jgi:hypothetical protein
VERFRGGRRKDPFEDSAAHYSAERRRRRKRRGVGATKAVLVCRPANSYGEHEDRTPTHGYEPTREACGTEPCLPDAAQEDIQLGYRLLD